MAIAIDGSTPLRWTGTPISTGTIVSGSFTAPADALLVVAIESDGLNSGTWTTVPTDSGGLAWTQRVSRQNTEATAGGQTDIWTARTTSAVARTVTVTLTQTGNPANGFRVSAVCYVFTGVDVNGTPVDTVGANNEGGSGTNNLTTTNLTPGANGILFAAGTDWAALGQCASSDLKGLDGAIGSSHGEYAGAIDVIDGWKVCTSGVAVNGNLDAAAGTPQWKWCQIIVREAATATPTIDGWGQPTQQPVRRPRETKSYGMSTGKAAA